MLVPYYTVSSSLSLLPFLSTIYLQWKTPPCSFHFSRTNNLLRTKITQHLLFSQTGNETSCPEGTFVQSNQDNTLTFFTDNTRSYDQVWFKPMSNRLPVRVKASRDAHFLLQTSNTSVAYEVVLGAFDNLRSDILLDGAALNETITVGVLRYEEFIPFVIAWNNRKIVVTRGTNDSDIVVEWSNPSANIDVQTVGLAGYKLLFQGEDNYPEGYQIQETEVSSYLVSTPARSAYKRVQRTLYGQDGQRFELATTGVAILAFLASDDKDFNQPTYKLTIGAQSNTQTTFYYRSNQLLLSNQTPGILSNGALREYWVAWKDGRFGFGLGSEFYENSTLFSSDSTGVEKFHSMAVDSTEEAQWHFVVQDYECVAACRVGWYSDRRAGNCQQCSKQLSHCFSCTQAQSSERPVCTACANGKLMLGEGGECISECPSLIGYTPNYDQRKCVCTYGSCCGPVAFRFCFLVIPCLLGVLLLVPVVLCAVRKLRRLHFIDPQRIDFDQRSMILNGTSEHVVEPHYLRIVRNWQESPPVLSVVYDSIDESLIAATPDETSFNHEVQASERNVDDLYVNASQTGRISPQNRGPLPKRPVSN